MKKNGENVCGIHGELNTTTCSCQCNEGWGGDRCQTCIRTCAHGRRQNDTCSCNCQYHWTGANCDICPLQCQNGGVLDQENCFCDCPDTNSGTSCEYGPCGVQIACDACLSVGDGCEWCARSSTCGQLARPGQKPTCTGPYRTGTCPPHGECLICTFTPSELRWLAINGKPSSLMDSGLMN